MLRPKVGDKMLKVSLQKEKRKKKEKPKKFTGKGLKIVDEDNFSSYKPAASSDDESAEDQPQIAAVVDERPVEVQVLESFNQGKWKRLEEDEEKSSVQPKHGGSDDESPPRQRNRVDSDGDVSPPRRKDLSPPRQRKRNNSSDTSPPRKRRDVSPPRQRKRQGSGDVSPPRRRDGSGQRKRRGSDDMSPPRRRGQSPTRQRRPFQSEGTSQRSHGRDRSPDRRNNSPSRRRRHNSGSDGASPVRQRRDDGHSRSFPQGKHQSPQRQRNRRNSSDTSPPRRRDMSSQSHRRKRESDDLSPPRRREPSLSNLRKRQASTDASPPRRRERSPPRHFEGRKRERDRNLARPEILDTSNNDEKISKTLDGKKAGLQKATALRDEMLEFRKREAEMFETLPEEISGRNAAPVKRDRRTEADLAKEAEAKKQEAERKEQYDKWGKGVKQVEEQQARVQSALHEMSKPLARYKDDDDLDEHLKKINREGDPMLEYLESKRRKAKGGGPEKPKYSGPQPPPNRFNILPGYRWDGVDRSNGYEKEWFGRINAKKAVQEEAYKWSVEDL